jgi:HK97 family phage major capsid protein
LIEVVNLNDEDAVRAQAADELHQQLMAGYRRDLDSENSTRRARQGGQLVYRSGGENSFFADLCKRALYGQGAHKSLESRLRDHARQVEHHHEYRTGLDTTVNAGGSLAPPKYVQSEFEAGAHPLRATADVCRLLPLPAKASQIVVPAFSSGTGAAVDSTQNSNLTETDPADQTVVCNTTTISARITVSRQLYDQASPDATVDRVLGSDVGAAYGAQLSSSVLTGSGSGQMTGLLNVSGVSTVSAASTISGLVEGIATGYQTMVETRYRKPSVCIMHPRRWLTGFANGVDVNGRPLQLPSTHPAALMGTPDDGVVAEWLGMKVILDVNIPTTSGSGNQDYVILGHSPDWLLYEGPLNFQAYKETLAAQMSIEVVAFKYAAFIPRYASSICLVGPFSPPTVQGS